MKVTSPKVELAVLRGMTHKDRKISGTLLGAVGVEHFSSPESIEIFHAITRNMKELGGSPSYRVMIDDPELSDEAREHFRESIAAVQSVADARKAAGTLNKYRQKRGLFNVGALIAERLKSSKLDLEKAMHDAAMALAATRSRKSETDSFVNFGKNSTAMRYVNAVLDDDISESIIPTGVKAFDDESMGLARGALFTIGANSGGGKSVAASALAVNMASMGYKVVLVPLEMSKKEMTARIMANVCNFDLTKLLGQKFASNDEKEKIRRKFKRWNKRVKNIGGQYTIFKPEEDLSIEEIYASLSAYHADVVIIDYIGLLKGVDGDDQVRALGQVARYAKINAENMNRVNVLCCQLNDDGKIKYSRAIAEHSANCWIWKATEESKADGGVTRVEQLKSRNSRGFPFLMRIAYNTMRIYDVDMDDDDAKTVQEQQPESSGKKKRKTLPNLAADI